MSCDVLIKISYQSYASKCANFGIEHETFFSSNSQTTSTICIGDCRDSDDLKMVRTSLLLIRMTPAAREKFISFIKNYGN